MKIPSKVYPYRLPYMGSKQNIAYSIMMAIAQKKPKAKYFFDIFGGGAAMSLMAKQFGLKVFYTEKNAGIVNLLNFLKDNPKSKIIQQIKNNKIIKIFYGLNEAHRETGISSGNISACCNGIRKNAGGYQWKYQTQGLQEI